ncbi:MAG: hypothetical protein IJV93_03760 [Lentisphaeria bacterium]|nr:hypothetical protein [Lentisphaeria bacterium]
MHKKLIWIFVILLLLPGNIYLIYHCFVSVPAKKDEFRVEGQKNDFLCRWQNNMASVIVENDNIIAVGAAAKESDFYWAVVGNCFMLNYNNAMVIDYNQDFLADYILMPDGKKYIQMKGQLIPISGSDLKNRSVTLPSGKVMSWQNGAWQ